MSDYEDYDSDCGSTHGDAHENYDDDYNMENEEERIVEDEDDYMEHIQSAFLSMKKYANDNALPMCENLTFEDLIEFTNRSFRNFYKEE